MNRVRGSKTIATLWLVSLTINHSIILAVQPVQLINKGPISCAELGDKLMSSYGMASQKELSEEEREENSKKIVLDIPLLSKQEMRKTQWGLAVAQENKKTTVTNDYQQKIYDATRLVIDDGEIFYSRDTNDHSQHAFSKIDCTETVAGETMLVKKLARPTSNIQELRSSQAFVAELVANEALFNECKALVQGLKNTESDFYSLWNRDTKATQDLVKGLYPVSEKSWFKCLNRSSAALETYTRLGNLGTIFQSTGDVFVGAATGILVVKGLRIVGAARVERELGYRESLGRQLSGMLPFKHIRAYRELKSAGTAKIDLWGGGDYQLPERGVEQSKDDLRDVFKAVELVTIPLSIVGLWQKYTNTKVVINAAKQSSQLSKLLQKRLMSAARIVNIVKEIDGLASKHTAMRNGMKSCANIKKVLRGSLTKSTDFKDLMSQLQTNTFKGEPSFFSYTGRVLAAYRNLQSSKDELADVLEIIGELDSYMAIATLYKKFAHQRVNYCFVEYQEGVKPYLALENFWNPQVDPNVVVTNNVTLGSQNGVRNIILTGSNTAGKSTLLKAIMLDVLMAQTFGIAPAKKMTMTPFTYFGSSMNIIDNTAQGISLYQAEVNRAVSLITSVQEVQEHGGNALLLMDELFRGTGATRADQETYTCAKELYSIDSAMYILATHYPTYPTKLEEETHGVCKNYKVDAYKDAQGRIVRPFKLEEGISNSNIASDILQTGLGKN